MSLKDLLRDQCVKRPLPGEYRLRQVSNWSEAGLKSMAKTVESLSSKIQQLEKANKQADESAILRLGSKLAR